MKKIFAILLFLSMMSFTCLTGPQAADQPAAPSQNLTGTLWQKMDNEAKLAFIYGIETVIGIDDYIQKLYDQQAAKSPKRARTALSPFEKAWMNALKDTTRGEVIEQVDAWYKANPDKDSRPVMDMIWKEIIEPKVGK